MRYIGLINIQISGKHATERESILEKKGMEEKKNELKFKVIIQMECKVVKSDLRERKQRSN